ncbi:DUF3800 domain-containing protein [Fodinibius sp. SL11]|uniref:DUF3800 domain-containing protein n=1 Tax=Fodinibius sp. SL11 TaxID=3425690 RepID=UPI003F8803AF
MKEYFAFIDESGDPNFHESASDHFFVGAIVFDKEEVSNARNKLQEVKRKFGFKELKSSKVGNNFERRKEIIADLSELKFSCLSIWVKKKELEGDWFRYKKTFFKYIQRLLHHEIYRLFRNTSVSLDQFGSEEYQESLEEYLVKHLQKELFEPDITIGNTENEELIQIADFFSGTLRKILKGDFIELEKAELLAHFKSVWNSSIVIPDGGKYLNTELFSGSDKYVDYFVKETKRYLESTNSKDVGKIKSLEYLFYTALLDPEAYVYRDEIITWLEKFDVSYSSEEFNQKVTAPLREEGQVISGTRKGLKLPTKMNDVYEYIDFGSSQALPILKRMKKSIKIIKANPNLPDVEPGMDQELKDVLDMLNA